MGEQPAPVPPAARPAAASAWAPFRHRPFAAMWGAQFVSNIGSWMQTVAAQWLMLTLTSSAAYVALVQTAAGLPVVLFAVLAGTIGDLVDRRRFLLVTQSLMLVAAAALGALAIAGLVTPWVLLALIFAVGTGQALTSPTWQTLQPELVGPAERPQAISLGAVNQNLARAVGPAIGGLILAATNAGTVFLANAVTFLAVLGVLAAWHSTRAPGVLPREHVGEAIRAGGRYVAASPALRVILIRAALFIFFASAIWALLPLTAQSALHLGSGGYGLLLGSVGIGAVGGAVLLPRLRARKLRHLVRARSTTCTAPGCGRPAARCDLDHTVAWDKGGLTCECGLSPLCRHHHWCKQARGWQLTQPEPGVLQWRTPSGRTYTTTPTEY